MRKWCILCCAVCGAEMERRNSVLHFLCSSGSRWLPAQAGTTPMATSYTSTSCCSRSSPQLSHFSKHIVEEDLGEIRLRTACPLPRMAWGMTRGLFPLLSSCLLMGVKDFSGMKTEPKDVAANRGRNSWSRAFDLLLLKRKQADSTGLGQPHKPDIKALSKCWCCCMNLLHLSWYKTEDMGHLDPSGIGNACPTLLPCSPLLCECLVHPGNSGMRNPSTRQLGNAASFARRAAHTQGCFYWGLSGQKAALGDTFQEMGKGHCLTKQGYRLPSIPLHWQLNKPLSHMWLCLKK